MLRLRYLMSLFVFFVAVSPVHNAFGQGRASLSYKPPVLPVEVTLYPDGEVVVSVTGSIVTPIGTFTVKGGYELNPKDGYTLVTVRKDGKDHVYSIHSDGKELELEISGPKSTRLRIKDRNILIDVADNDFHVKFFGYREGQGRSRHTKPAAFDWDRYVHERREAWNRSRGPGVRTSSFPRSLSAPFNSPSFSVPPRRSSFGNPTAAARFTNPTAGARFTNPLSGFGRR